MTITKFIALLFLSLPLQGIGQLPADFVRHILKADTIYLVVHQQTDGIAIVDPLGNKSFPPRVVVDGCINQKIVTCSALLLSKDRRKIAEILARSFSDRKVETCRFIPFNGIVIINAGKASLIDVSLECRAYLLSDVHGERYYNMDGRKWAAMKKLFRDYGVTSP